MREFHDAELMKIIEPTITALRDRITTMKFGDDYLLITDVFSGVIPYEANVRRYLS